MGVVRWLPKNRINAHLVFGSMKVDGGLLELG